MVYYRAVPYIRSVERLHGSIKHHISFTTCQKGMLRYEDARVQAVLVQEIRECQDCSSAVDALKAKHGEKASGLLQDQRPVTGSQHVLPGDSSVVRFGVVY